MAETSGRSPQTGAGSSSGPRLAGRFASELPELAVPWQAADVPEPDLLVLNEGLAAELGLDAGYLRSPEGLRLLVGNHVPQGATPVAQAYAGHQFGVHVPRLGDGRALLLGELTGPDGGLRDLHLKGSGPTPFARGGDGFAAVGPMLREYVVSEAMHALGIPTTRSLAVVATGRPVRRETILPGAVLARVAAGHLRVGSFQYARATGDVELLRRLTDVAIARHHPEAASASNPALALFESVLAAQADLVAQWMLVGFVHGVLNTDNTTISGETIDYGPCAFMDVVDPATVFSSIDARGRYAYGNQPAAVQWNLARLAESLIPLVHQEPERAVELLTSALAAFPAHYAAAWNAGMRRKLGLGPHVPDDDVATWAAELTSLQAHHRVDHTSFFRRLSKRARGDVVVLEAQGDTTALTAWLDRWLATGPDPEMMDRANPLYIPRNHLVEEALEAATAGDLVPVERLLAVVTDPYRERPGLAEYTRPAPGAGPYVTYCGT